MNRLIRNKEIESVTKSLPSNKTLGPNDFPGDFYQTFKGLVPVLYKLMPKTWKRKTKTKTTREFVLWGHYHSDTKTRQGKV